MRRLRKIIILPTGPVSIAAVVSVTLDAAGNATGTESRNVGGGFADETFSGTYTVNPDCTGTATINFFESEQLVRTSVLSLIFDNKPTRSPHGPEISPAAQQGFPANSGYRRGEKGSSPKTTDLHPGDTKARGRKEWHSKR